MYQLWGASYAQDIHDYRKWGLLKILEIGWIFYTEYRLRILLLKSVIDERISQNLIVFSFTGSMTFSQKFHKYGLDEQPQ